jgi:hypothetical protein
LNNKKAFLQKSGMRMRASESPIQRQKKIPMRRVSFAEASDVFWLVLFPDEPNREAAIQGWALEMLHHPDPNQGPALRKIEQPNPDLADRISLTIEGRTLTLGVAVGSGETLTFSRRLTPTLRLIECLPKVNPIHALLRGPQHRYCRDQVCKFLGSVADHISSTICRALKSAPANRRLTIWGPSPANPCGRLIKFEVLPVNLDRVEIAGPMTARAQAIKPRSFAEADRPILAAMHDLITGPKRLHITAAARKMLADGRVLKLGTDASAVERLRRSYTAKYRNK